MNRKGSVKRFSSMMRSGNGNLTALVKATDPADVHALREPCHCTRGASHNVRWSMAGSRVPARSLPRSSKGAACVDGATS